MLGIPRGSDRAEIRRAYARALKITNPEDDPQGFMALREAYETALNWVDYDDYDYHEDETDDAPVPVEVDAVQRPIWAEPAAEPVLADPDPFAEIRTVEQGDLRRLTAALEGGLRGPWHGDAAALSAQIDAILGAPALIEIETRDSIEYWLSNLLADTVPRSDAILMQAVAAFGWEQEGNRPPAVWQILNRIDEWRIIEALGRSDHNLAAGWRALTAGGKADWQRRVAALRPGAAGQVRQLFDLADYQAPGIAHSFEPQAAVWWRAHLDKPRFGFVDLAAILLGALAAAIFAAFSSTRAWQMGGAAAALFAGVAFAVLRLRVIAPWRLRREEAGIAPGWASQGWLALWLGAALLVIWTPAGPWMAGVVVTLCLISGLWMAVVVGHEPRIGSAIGGIISFGALALLGGAAFFALTGPEKLALLAFGAASLLIGSAGSGGLLDVLWRAGSRPVAAAILLAVLLLAAATGRSLLPAPPQPLVPFGAAAIAGMVVMNAVRDQHDGSWLSRVAPLLRWALWITLVIAAILSSPPVERSGGQRPAKVIEQLDFKGAAEALEASEPGFAVLRTGNLALHQKIVAIRQQIAARKRNHDEGATEISRLVNREYRKRLPLAPAALIASEFDIQLATLREYQPLDLRACAMDEPGPEVSRDLQIRHFRHALAVAGTAPASAASLAEGRVQPMVELLNAAAGQDQASAKRMNDVLSTQPSATEAFKARCAARIAVLEALTAQSDADIAKTMRPALIARAAKSSAKAKAADQAP